MDILALINAYGGWSWVVFGVILLAVELVAPGGFFVWLGVSAILTGLGTLIIGFGWDWQLAVFGLLSLATISIWVAYIRGRRGRDTDQPLLNRRAERLVGREAALGEPIEAGFGRLELGETVWRVSGPDLSAGTRVRVTGHDGAVLKVEAAPRSDNTDKN